jgi:uncharacterized protein YbjT (DUF2867 family)
VAVVTAAALAANALAVVATVAVAVAVVAVAALAAVVVVATAAVAVNAAAAVATVAATKPPSPQRTALLAGATGLVGRELLRLLLADARYSAVHCVGRRAPTLTHPKLAAHVADLSSAAQLDALPVADDVYIALGTTIKVAGSQAAFKAIDLDAVVALAQSNIARAATKDIASSMRLGVVSAMGADAQSSVFYNRTKGQMEAAVAQLGYASVSIARPSMLAGDRASLQQTARPGEQIGLKLMGALQFLIPANYQAIEAADVASALHRMVTHGTSGTRVALSGELRDLAQTA